jgi:preprotein translocase subunit SecB
MSQVTKAKFALIEYVVSEFHFKGPNGGNQNMKVDFKPTGNYMLSKSEYELFLEMTCKDESEAVVYLSASIKAIFQLRDNENTIPQYFYANSIAIVYPYIRAFVSTVSLQSNTGHILLPTMNLSDLGPILEENTSIVA